jgi:hypothetical protein
MSADEGFVPFEEDPTAPEEAPEEVSEEVPEEAPEEVSEEVLEEAEPAELSALQRFIGKFRRS